jgi:predicted RNase H-like HicB family nuclease
VPGSNYSVYVPNLPGCVAAADTLEEIKQLMQEGIEFRLEGMKEDGDPVPEPTTQVDHAGGRDGERRLGQARADAVAGIRACRRTGGIYS